VLGIIASMPYLVPAIPTQALIAQAPLPANASRIQAKVLKQYSRSASEFGELNSSMPYHCLTLSIDQVKPKAENTDLLTLAQVGQELDVCSDQALPMHLIGKQICATVRLINSRTGNRWLIEDFSHSLEN
jgi:hypothetical protein